MNQSSFKENEISLGELIDELWKHKLIITIAGILCAVVSVLYALSLPNIYTSEVVLAPTQNAQNEGGNIGGQVGALASLAGFQVGSTGPDKKTIALEVAKSKAFIISLVEKHNMLPDLFAVESWSQSRGIVYDSQLYDSSLDKWVDSEQNEIIPKNWKIIELVKTQLLKIDENLPGGLIKISSDHQSPEFAKRFLDLLVFELNNVMRERDIGEAKRSLEFLNRELSATNLNNVQQIFYELIEQQTQTMMLANARPEYVFQIVDPPVVAERKSKPSRASISILGTLLGVVLAIIVIMVRFFLKK